MIQNEKYINIYVVMLYRRLYYGSVARYEARVCDS